MKIRFKDRNRIAAAGIIIFLMIQVSCYYPRTSPGWEYMPDMAHSVAYETYAPNSNFPDSSNARLPVFGTIPRGTFMPFHYSSQPAGYDSAGLYLHFPDGLTEADKLEGQRLFGIYCAVCHGFSGKGNGSIVVNAQLKNPFPPPPSYYDDQHINLPEGKEYYSVHYGKNLMGAYSHSLDQNQIWKIIDYVKSMQIRVSDSLKALPPVAVADTTKKKASTIKADTTKKK